MHTLSLPITESAHSITTNTDTMDEIKVDEGDSSLTFTKGLPAREVHLRAQAARRLQGRSHHLLAHWLLEVEERKLHLEMGYSSVYHYAELSLNLEGHTVAEYLRTARALENFPLLSEAYQNGSISASKLREITRVVEKDTENYWLEMARNHTTRQIEKMVVFSPRQNLNRQQLSSRGDCPSVDCPPAHPDTSCNCSTDPTTRPTTGLQSETEKVEKPPDILCCAENRASSFAHYRSDFNKEHTRPDIPPQKYIEKMVLELSGEQTAVVHDAFRKARKESGLSDRAALVTYMARAFLDDGAASKILHSKRPPYQVVLHHQSGITWTESERGPVYVPDTMYKKAVCDADIVDIETRPENYRNDYEKYGINKQKQALEEAQGTPVHVIQPISRNIELENTEPDESVNGLFKLYRNTARTIKETGSRNTHARTASGKSSTRIIPSSRRKKVLLRDGGRCQAPGCGRNRFVEIHHIQAVSSGGIHSLSNLLVLCGSCHTNVHEGRLTVEGEAPGRLRWRRI
jgi:hypothetical protein